MALALWAPALPASKTAILPFCRTWILIRIPRPDKTKGPSRGAFYFIGGEEGIRTLDTLPYTHFPGVLLQPLGHLSKNFKLRAFYPVILYLMGGARGRARYSTASQSHPFGAAGATRRRSFGCASSQPLGHLS